MNVAKSGLLKAFVLLSMLFSISGCWGVYAVSDETNSGIAYFPIVQKDIVTAVYLEEWDEIQLTFTQERCSGVGQNLQCESIDRDDLKRTSYSTDETCTAEISKNYVGAESTKAAFDLVINYFDTHQGSCENKLKPAAPVRKAISAIGHDADGLSTIGVEREQIAVASKVAKYINVKVPVIGSATATVALNEKGTLTSATATVEPKTLETILAALPIKDFISFDLDLNEVAAAPVADQDTSEKPLRETSDFKTTKTSLSVTRYQRLYSVTAPDNEQRSSLPAASACGANLAIVERKSEVGAAKKPDSSSITFQGSVKLPEVDTEGSQDSDK